MPNSSSIHALQGPLDASLFSDSIACLGLQAPWDFYIVSSATALLLLGCWAGAKVLDMALTKSSSKYASMSSRTKKNICIYILEVVITTPAFLYCVALVPESLDMSSIGTEDTVVEQYKAAGTMGSLVVHLYIFEMLYKDRIDWMLLTHHLMTILVGVVLWNALYYTLDLRIVPYFATSLLFAAVTEQPTFIALLLYRFSESRVVRRMLQFAAIWSCITKVYAFCLTWAVYHRGLLYPTKKIISIRGSFDWELFFKVYIPIASILLVVLQLKANYTLYLISLKHASKSDDSQLQVDRDTVAKKGLKESLH
ncbi:hypothetical protein GUITHDRAFT_103170 [Guillardia theta CCMP2712]|uniref:TLC domain-containing protein n=1 Tax=Guillardia theta (strain CCMP2712) TaxID=905079 RepID=L1JT46_GUITC|nr:hypothetical protein GUITHDRAFT_103170 [Guillardia theta CCMP2712]EKX51253.1 hypothetical protein GUITHDRAFT_103170 [Guillardia theta CCMP2712]|eukprot:XP_005838233.1 hypothetical protein GUITHDRAFT_103170 [Guillardia theta CCMP2712]